MAESAPTAAEQLAEAVLSALVAAGVRDVVLTPGSRNAPLALGLHAADAEGRLRLHVRIDERGAGFLAVGLARASERPVAVATTSGTAVANLHPAVLEAWHSGVPLVIVSADRPEPLRWTGANQTTHQDALFAGHLRAWSTVGDDAAARSGAAFEVARLLAAAAGTRTRLPGPVQLNLRLNEPLVSGAAARPARAAPVRASLVAASRPAEPAALPAGPRTVVVAGDLTPARGRALAAQAAFANVPLLAEPSSNARAGSAALGTYRLLLGGALGREIERVVVRGRPTLSRPVAQLLARRDIDVVVVAEQAEWVDPGRAARLVVDDVAFSTPGLADREWFRRWQQADRVVRVGVDRLLTGLDHLCGPVLAGTLMAALGPADVLFAGSSNPIRDLDLAPVGDAPPAVYANRGLSGIDGLVSSAVGVSLGAGRPGHALLGDLTAAHDANALLIAASEPRPDLRLLIANDDGGSIFAGLEQGGAAYVDAFERVFATPQAMDLAALAAAVHVPYRKVRSRLEVTDTLTAPPRGLELVEVVIDRAHRRELDAALMALGKELG